MHQRRLPHVAHTWEASSFSTCCFMAACAALAAFTCCSSLSMAFVLLPMCCCRAASFSFRLRVTLQVATRQWTGAQGSKRA